MKVFKFLLVQSGTSTDFKYSDEDQMFVWEVLLPPVYTSGIKCMVTIQQEDVVKRLMRVIFGDVWICSGIKGGPSIVYSIYLCPNFQILFVIYSH